jgi:hypothetical protein
VGEVVSVGVRAVVEGVGRKSVGEDVGEGVGVALPWIDGCDDCSATATTSLAPCFWGYSADFNPNTADLCGYWLRGTCESASTEMKWATFSWACLGMSVRTRVRTAVMAAARPPMLRMGLLKRSHHRIEPGLAGWAWRVGGLEGRPDCLLLRLVMTSAPYQIFIDLYTGPSQCNGRLAAEFRIFMRAPVTLWHSATNFAGCAGCCSNVGGADRAATPTGRL